MRVVALEEHFTVPALVKRIDPAAIARRGFRQRRDPTSGPKPLELAPEIGEQRMRLMDEAGITVQVLSNTGPGPDLVPGAEGIAISFCDGEERSFEGYTIVAANTRFYGGGMRIAPEAKPDDGFTV